MARPADSYRGARKAAMKKAGKPWEGWIHANVANEKLKKAHGQPVGRVLRPGLKVE